MRRLISFLTLLLVAVFTANAQVTTSKIRGSVADNNGEALFGATVVVLHVPTGTQSGTITQDNGKFTVPNLRVGGPYKVTFSFVGFKSHVVENIFLTLGETTIINGKLAEEGEQLDEIVIESTGGNATFSKDRTGARTSVSSQQLRTLPTISRSQSDFTRLEPSASNGSFGGRNDQFNNFSLDGSIFNNPFGLDAATPGGQTNSQPISLDAIEQVSVSTAPYDVTLSGFTGASVNAVTKSGTNDFKGTVYGFFRNENLTGGKIKGDKVFKSDLSQNQYGMSIGGPIIKDKLFFFANFEKDEITELGSGFTPNTGSGAINESSVLASDLQLVSDLLSQINVNGGKYNPGSFQGFNFDAESTKGIFKLDWNINKDHRLAVVYNFLRASKEKPAHPTALGFRGPNASILQFENAGYEINNNLDSYLLELNSTFNETTTNKLQVGFTHFDDFRNPLSTPAPSISIQNNGANYIIAGHEPFSVHNRLDQKVFQLTNNMNFFAGDHTFTVGLAFEKFMFDNSFNLGVYGARGTFFPTGDIQSFRDAAGNATLWNTLLADYQQMFDDAIAAHNGLEAAGEGNPGGWALAETNVGQLAFYIQDEWEVTDNFKLTAGIRFDKPLYFDTSERAQDVIDVACCYHPENEYFNPNTGETVFLDNTKMPSSDWLISPRVGVNWDVKGDKSLQIRGGSGLFTGRLPFVWLGNQIANPNFFFYQMVDPDFKYPQVWRTNLGVDYKTESGYIFSTDLAYTKDINGAHVQNWGMRNPSGTLGGPDGRPYYLPQDFSQDLWGGPVSAYVFTNSDKGRTYNATFKVEKTFDNGFYFNTAYNYLNSKDVNSIEAEITGDAFVFNPVVGNANNDVLSYSKYGDTHRVIGVAAKEFHFFGENNPTSISAIFEYAQGGRFNYTYGGDANGDGSGLNDLLYVPTESELGSMNFSGPGMADAFNDYIKQDDYLSGIRGEYVDRYGALAPWRGRWDIKLLQDIAVTEGSKFQLSIDVLNFGNLINSNWGLVQQPRNLQPVGISVDANQNPTYTFNSNLVETFGYNSELLSRWQAQVGLRYIF